MADHHFNNKGHYVGSTLSTEEVGKAAKFAWGGLSGCFMIIGIPAFIIVCAVGIYFFGGLLFQGVKSGIASLSTNLATQRSVSHLVAMRGSHTATLLSSGRVLVVGGIGEHGILATADLYDPISNTWSSGASMKTARWEHTATLLSSGQVLVTGGKSRRDGRPAPLARADYMTLPTTPGRLPPA